MWLWMIHPSARAHHGAPTMGAALATPTDAELDGLPHWPSDERTELRWAVEIETWHPGACEWRFLNALLPTVEQTAIAKYRFPVDRRRALVSRLLQRRCVAHALGIPDERVVIARTKGNKPFDATHVLGQEETPQQQPPQPQPPQQKPPQRGNFNFNVSHEGHWVVLASDPALLIGVDVSAPFELRGGPKPGDYAEVVRLLGDGGGEAITTLDEAILLALPLSPSIFEHKARAAASGMDVMKSDTKFYYYYYYYCCCSMSLYQLLDVIWHRTTIKTAITLTYLN
jgi:hypothetical protein